MPVVIKGADEVRRALRKFDPDLYKEMNKEIRPVLSGMVRQAKALVPTYFLSGAMSDGSEAVAKASGGRGFPKYDSTSIRKGLTYSMGRQKRQRNGWQSLYSLLNKSAMGVIVEWAGRRNANGAPDSRSNNPHAGQQFIDRANQIGSLKQVGKGRQNQGRIAFAAVHDNFNRAVSNIKDAIDRAQSIANRRTR